MKIVIPVLCGTQCAAETKSGERCKNKVKRTGSYAGPFCNVHGKCLKCKRDESGGERVCGFHGGNKGYNVTANFYKLNRIVKDKTGDKKDMESIKKATEDFVLFFIGLNRSDPLPLDLEVIGSHYPIFDGRFKGAVIPPPSEEVAYAAASASGNAYAAATSSSSGQASGGYAATSSSGQTAGYAVTSGESPSRNYLIPGISEISSPSYTSL